MHTEIAAKQPQTMKHSPVTRPSGDAPSGGALSGGALSGGVLSGGVLSGGVLSGDDDVGTRPGAVQIDLDAHLVGDAHRLFDEGLDDLRFRDGLDDLALDEDLPLAVAGGHAEVGLPRLAR